MPRPLTCHNCRFFQPDGHYHGSCSQLDITVEGEWIACQLSLPAFDRISSDLSETTSGQLDRQNWRSGNTIARLIAQLQIEAME
ncbi:hypothetical protein [Chamaesiphon sp.]|uniref:hypothetical protein n=1 Tax=Chamaesiphon sp. TaxID=2814140 RepID=UPI003592EA36